MPMGFFRRHLNLMSMLVVNIVAMFMVVFQQLMRVFVAVALGQVQPYSECHERASSQQSRAEGRRIPPAAARPSPRQ
jgi:hypothetical protein